MNDFDKKLFEMAENEAVEAPSGLMGRVRSALAGLPDRRTVNAGRTVRMAVCCAAAVAVLAGTALAVFSAGGFESVKLWSGEGFSGDELNWYGVEGGEYRFVPVEELSEDVRAMAEDNPVADTTKYFRDRDWSAAESFSGVTLPENPVIDALEIGTSYLTVSANSEGPTLLRFWQGTPKLGVSMSAEVYTDQMRTDGLIVNRGYSQDYELSADEYTTVNGLSALIVHLDPAGVDVNEEEYEAELLVDGVRYHIRVRVNGEEIISAEEALETLHGILDGFSA